MLVIAAFKFFMTAAGKNGLGKYLLDISSRLLPFVTLWWSR